MYAFNRALGNGNCSHNCSSPDVASCRFECKSVGPLLLWYMRLFGKPKLLQLPCVLICTVITCLQSRCCTQLHCSSTCYGDSTYCFITRKATLQEVMSCTQPLTDSLQGKDSCVQQKGIAVICDVPQVCVHDVSQLQHHICSKDRYHKADQGIPADTIPPE